jgi:excisionase family DNA binding protein
MNTSTPRPHAPEQFFRPNEAAKRLGVCRRTLYRIVADGHLTIFKVRGCACIASEQLSRYMKQRMGEAVP